MSNNWKGKGFVVGAVIGGILGAATALLTAPKTGRELRGDLAEQYGKISDKTSEIAGVVGSKTQAAAKVVGSKTQAAAKVVGEQTEELVGKAKAAAGSVVSELKAWKESRKESVVSEGTVDTQPVVEEAQEGRLSEGSGI